MEQHVAQSLGSQFWMWLIGVVIIIMQAIQVLQQKRYSEKFSQICEEIKNLWSRTNKHGHTIECNHADCKPKTTGVIISDKE